MPMNHKRLGNLNAIISRRLAKVLADQNLCYVSEKTGISRARLYRIMAGESDICIHDIEIICDALDAPTSDIFTI